VRALWQDNPVAIGRDRPGGLRGHLEDRARLFHETLAQAIAHGHKAGLSSAVDWLAGES